MANNYYSNQGIHIEAFFGETNNICICSRAHLKDYYTSNDYYNAYDNETCTEDITENFESIHSHDEKLKDSIEDSDMCYENAFQEDLELMESMGLPTSFGRKDKEHKNYGYYSAYNHDEYENSSENEESACFEKSEQYDESSDINNLVNPGDFSYYKKTVVAGDFVENDSEFASFWTLHGYTVCLNTWIEKYKNYISPEFLEALSDHKNSKSEGSKLNSIICSSDNDKSVVDTYSSLDIKTDQNYDTSEIVQDVDEANFSPRNNESISKLTENEDDDEMHKNDHALKNINDKFQCMSFSEENETGLPENIDLEISLENNDLYLEDVLPSNEDLSASKFQSDLLEKVVCCLDLQPVGDLSSKTATKSQSELDSNATVDESNKLENISDFNSPIEQESYFDNNFRILKFLFNDFYHVEQTDNPLFIHTTSEKEYVARISNVDQTWEELWASHCQEEYDKYSKMFSEDSFMLSKYITSDLQKCKLCGSEMCNLDCQNDGKDCNDEFHTEILSNNDTKKNLKYSKTKSLTNSVINCYASTDLSVPDNILTVDCSSEIEHGYDDEPHIELPVKRSHEITESEDEDPEDMIKGLGLIIQPTNALRIKKNNCHKYFKRFRNQYRPSDEEDTQFILNPENHDINTNNENNDGKSKNFTDAEAKYEELVTSENVEYEELAPNENVEYEELAPNENVEYKELVYSENVECKELVPSENVECKELVHSENVECKELVPSENMEYQELVPCENVECEESEPIENNDQMDEVAYENDMVLNKYWHQRYRLFNRFDEGIKLDEESWFSVTPERIAEHIAERCACGIMVDAFCGAGGNAIQFASYCYHVIAIDIDPKKIELAKHNATIYGVADYIDFIVGDYFDIAPLLKADGVFLSPPWGGPSYAKDAEYNIEKIEPNIYKVFEVSKRISQNIALFVPKNTIINQLVQLSGEGNSVEIEQNFLNKKVKTITAYYGDFVSHSSADSVKD